MKETNPIQFEKVGGSFQPIIKTAEDMKNLLSLSPAFWSITSLSLDAVSMDPVFLKFMDSDCNGKIRVDEIKTAVSWVLGRLKNYKNLENGSDTLVLEDLNQDDIEAGDIRDSAVLALKNTGVSDPKEICLRFLSRNSLTWDSRITKSCFICHIQMVLTNISTAVR